MIMNLNQKAMIARAGNEAKMMGNDYIGSEHVLLALLRQGEAALARRLAAQGIYYFQVREDVAILFGMKEQKQESQEVTQIVDVMLAEADELHEEKQGTLSFEDCVGSVLPKHPASVAMELLKRYHVDLEEEAQTQGVRVLDEQEALRCMNFSDAPDLVHRQREMEMLVEILLRKEKANPLLIGEPGVGKSALVEALAVQIQQGEIPQLAQHFIYELDLNALVAGTRYRGDFEEKIKNLLALFRAHPNAILFIDEIHQMIGAGRSEGSIDVASVIKPCLARRTLRCIGATTLDEYERHMEGDRALQRRFQCVLLREPDVQDTVDILQKRREEYGRYHDVELGADLIPSLVELSDYYLPHGHFPDKAIDVMDLCCVRTKRNKETTVSADCVREVIREMAHIPLDPQQRMARCVQDMQEFSPLPSWNEAIQKELHRLCEERCSRSLLRCWALCAPENAVRELLAMISEDFFCRRSLISADAGLLSWQKEEVVRQLRRTPFAILFIHDLSSLSVREMALLANEINAGALSGQGEQALLRHALLVLHDEQESVLRSFCARVKTDLYLCGEEAPRAHSQA